MPARRPLFALVIGLNALLLFLVQPLAGKLLLPLAGGSPAVWSGCLLFFQGALLAGYALAHVGARWLAPRALVSVHVVVLVLAMPTLPIGIDGAGLPPADADPTWWILWTLVTSLGLPFTALAAGAPLLQHDFAATAGPSDGDPYALYAASNTGSLLALFAYPFLVEPWLPVSRQRVGWTALYGVLVLLLLLVARAVAAARAAQGGDPREEHVGLGAAPGPDQDAAERIPPAQVARWLLLSFVPTALLMAVTAFITTDVAAVPLLWILPRGIGIVAAPTIAFFLIALVLHGELHRRRPSPRHLTAFHLTISLGGVLGGVFVVLVAPLLSTITLELPIALALAAWCIPMTGRTSDAPVPTWQWVATLAFAIGIMLAGIEHTAVSWEHGTKGAIAATVAMATDTATPDASAPATTAPHEPSRDRGRRAPR